MTLGIIRLDLFYINKEAYCMYIGRASCNIISYLLNQLGVWLNSVSTDTLTNESVHKIEKSRPKGRKMIVEESVERGLVYYFISRFQFFVGVSLLILFSIGLEVFGDTLIMGEPFKDFSEECYFVY